MFPGTVASQRREAGRDRGVQGGGAWNAGTSVTSHEGGIWARGQEAAHTAPRVNNTLGRIVLVCPLMALY